MDLEFIEERKPEVMDQQALKAEDEFADFGEFKTNILMEELEQAKSQLPAIQECTCESEDEEFEGVQFEQLQDIDEHEPSRKFTNSLSRAPSSLRSTVDLDTSLPDADFIDFSQVTELKEVKLARKYFRYKWWLVNPESAAKQYWDYFVGIFIVVWCDPALCRAVLTRQVQLLRRHRHAGVGHLRLLY